MALGAASTQASTSGPAGGRRSQRWARFLARPGGNRFSRRDRGFDQQVVRAADQQKMLGVVATDDDELALPVEIEHVDHVEATRTLLGPGANAAPEQETDDVEDEKRGDQERHDCSQYRKQS